jgi:hypothetical protein
MRRWISTLAALVVIAAPVAGEKVAQGGDESPGVAGPAASLTDFELIQYTATGRLSPEGVMSLDNNGDILLACRESCTLDELRQSGVEATASQLQLLQVMNLLRREADGRWATSFPILNAAKSADLRAEADGLARKALAALRPEIESLQQALHDGGLQSHGYAVFFSYVLDGMVWGFFEEYGRVPVRRLSAARPFWAGEIWALETPREDWVGTATIADRGLTLKVVMSRPVQERVRPLLGGRAWIKQALEEYLDQGRVADGEPLELLKVYVIVDERGMLIVPVIDEVGRDSVFLAAESLSSGLVDWILEEVDIGPLRTTYDLRREPQALVVVYHELMWSLLTLLEEEGVVDRPSVLEDLAGATNRELGQLMILVDRANRAERDDSDSGTSDLEEEGEQS